MEAKKPDDFLNEAANLFVQKNDEYGGLYLTHQKLLTLLFPRGIMLEHEEDFAMYSTINAMLSKITRFAHIWNSKSVCHVDSLLDLMVYASMGLEVGQKFGIMLNDTKVVKPQEEWEADKKG